MIDLKGKVAVVTGGASGIGLAFAQRCLKEGMRVVLADIDQRALAREERRLRQKNAPVLAVPVDVSKAEGVENLCNTVYEQLGSTDILYNNAGVFTMGYAHTAPLADWTWILGVNLWGVIHGVHYFVPRMIQQDTEGYVLNTASIAGLMISHAMPAYSVSKAAVISLTESLQAGFQMCKAKLHASVVCPGFIATNIGNCESHRPRELRTGQSVGLILEGMTGLDALVQQESLASQMQPNECAEIIFHEAILEGKFGIFPNAKPVFPRWKSIEMMLKKS